MVIPFNANDNAERPKKCAIDCVAWVTERVRHSDGKKLNTLIAL